MAERYYVNEHGGEVMDGQSDCELGEVDIVRLLNQPQAEVEALRVAGAEVARERADLAEELRVSRRDARTLSKFVAQTTNFEYPGREWMKPTLGEVDTIASDILAEPEPAESAEEETPT